MTVLSGDLPCNNTSHRTLCPPLKLQMVDEYGTNPNPYPYPNPDPDPDPDPNPDLNSNPNPNPNPDPDPDPNPHLGRGRLRGPGRRLGRPPGELQLGRARRARGLRR